MLLNKYTVILFVSWLLIVPTSLTYMLLTHDSQVIEWPYLLLFAVFGVLTLVYPIKINGKSLNLVSWVTIPAFLIYGLLFELLLMQISILGTAFFKKEQSETADRFFLNSLLFFVLSILSAQAFYFVSGEIGSVDFWPIVLSVAVYQLVHRGLYIVVKIAYTYFKKGKLNEFTKDVLLENALVICIIPFALTIYFLIKIIGIGAFVLLGIPFFFMISIHRLYNNTERINHDLQLAVDIGQGLSNHLNEEKVINQFVEKVAKMFNAEFTYLFDHHDGWLELIRSYEHGAFMDIQMNQLSVGEGIAGMVLKDNRPAIFAKRKDWITSSSDYAPDEMQSVITIPISRNQEIVGVLFIASIKRDAFNEYQLKILDILCSYFTVSIEKVRNIEETVRKSERCGLTKLYNYAYLKERLDFEGMRTQQGNLHELAVVILDIDHFKKVNDSYGHQSGNDILSELAILLENHVPKNGIVGRYGGEEFIYVLPDMRKKEANRFAENLREVIASHRFQIASNLNDSAKSIEVNITVSIAVAALPNDTDDVKNLVRYADRALYLGAKRAGRNRVAVYGKS